MSSGQKQRLLRQTLLLAAITAMMLYVAADAVRGPHGLIANQLLRTKVVRMKQDLAALKAQRVRLERDAELLNTKAASEPALLDEEARALLDLAQPTDIVIVNSDKSEP